MLRTLYREFNLGPVSTRDSTPISEIFEVLVRGTKTISPVEHFHGHDLSILVKCTLQAKKAERFFFYINDQFYGMI